jgi:Glyoxalase/Bleomycin resistance protein/Dioxygenase superfamily
VLIWIQVRDVHAGHVRLAAAGVPIVREPAAEPWGLTEMWIEDPDGVRIVLVEVSADHPLAATRGRRYRYDGDPYAA